MANPTGEPEVFEQMQVRLDKRARLIEQGQNPYPVGGMDITDIVALRAAYNGLLEFGEKSDVTVTVSGRVISIRNVGKLSFAVLQQGRGATLQIMLSRGEIGDESHAAWKQDVDLGDVLNATGLISRSSTGELSVFVSAWRVVAKALRPMPNTHDALNEETRARQRYLDLMVSEDARRNMLLRPRVVREVRNFFEHRDYIEVETPMLQTIHGGAAARPFVTHSNALDMDLYLRIAPELFLKRAIIGGGERVFEVNRNFRNEGIDATHSPEFTMLEAYQVNADYLDMANLVESLLRQVVANSGEYLTAEAGARIDAQFAGTWQRIHLYASLSDAVGEEITPSTSIEHLQQLADANGVEVPVATHGKLVEELWEHFVKPNLTTPTFVLDYPVDTSPLVSGSRHTPGVVEKWDLYINGMEVATGYSELTDPVIQRQRLVEQAKLGGRGDDEAMALDEAFLTAMEYGMSPTGGIGLGIDRLMLLLTGGTIRDNVLFPLVK